MELIHTASLMASGDYRDRFKAEYLQVKIRYNKLCDMTASYEAGTLNFKPLSSLELLKRQQVCMGEYLRLLEARANIEGIMLDRRCADNG